jgi:hypothetical protein
MFCRNCGQEIEDNAAICVHCGAQQGDKPQVVDNGGFGWGLLGCCVPLAGLILFLIWKDEKPKTAKAAGIGALVSVICYVVFIVLYFILIFALAAGSAAMF